MGLNMLAGNDRLKEQLSRQGEGRGLAHAYIISGPVGSGRHTLARQLCAAMLCTGEQAGRPCGCCGQCKKVMTGIHPDVAVISGPGEGKGITVDQIRSLRADAYIRPNEGARKIYVLEQAQWMNASAQNAMLKLLEEGPAYAVFLLLSDHAGGLLQTVRSRCEELTLSPVPLKACIQWLSIRFPHKTEQEVRQAAEDCQGILGRAVAALEGADQQLALKEQARTLARAMSQGSELALFEASMVLDKLPKEQIPLLLDEVRVCLTAELAAGGDGTRLLKGTRLLEGLNQAAALNVNPGQLAGWLCAGMFV